MFSYFLHTSQLATQTLLRKLLTEDLPGLMVLPKRIEIAIPPSVTSVAEAAVGRDTIMRAVASAVLQVRRESGAQEAKWLALEMQRYWQGNYACRRKCSAAGEEDGSGCLGKWCRTGSKSKGNSVAEAAVGRDTIMRAVASAVLQVREQGSGVRGRVVQNRKQIQWSFSCRDSCRARHDCACGGQCSAAGEEGKWRRERKMAGAFDAEALARQLYSRGKCSAADEMEQ